MATTTSGTVRAAAYLEHKQRLDVKGKVKCNPPNRQCGERCIPPNWKCRVKGEGTDSHSRVVAGDPLAGAASIARGQARLRKGFQTGNLADIQGGRAAIERGIVKAVPGQNIQQKQKLRSTLNKALLPVATTVFGTWAIRQGHEGLKLLIPQYREGLGRQIEESANNAINRVLDAVPISGPRRIAQRRLANLEAQRLGRAVSRSYTRNPEEGENNFGSFSNVSEARRGAYPGLATQIQQSYADLRNRRYAEFRSELLGRVVGATDPDGNSIYAKVAAADFVARRFSINPESVFNDKGVPSSFQVESRVSSALTSARAAMRQDMQVRGLNPKNVDHVDRYTEIAFQNAAPRLRGLSDATRQSAENDFRGMVRELVLRPQNLRDEVKTKKTATEMLSEAEESYNKYYRDFSASIRETTAPTSNVVASGQTGLELRSTIIATANRIKSDVGFNGSYRIAGVNHAELVLQKLYYERVVPGNYNGRRSGSWIPSRSEETSAPGRTGPTDTVILGAAREMGWRGSNLDEAVGYLQRNGFRRLAPRPRTQERPIGRQRENAAPANPTARPRRKKPVERSREQIIQMLMRGGISREAAEREADQIRARRSGETTDADELSPRIRAYLEQRQDFREASRLGKPCGKSFIPKGNKCRQGEASATPTDPQSPQPSSPRPAPPTSRGKAKGIVLAALGATAGTAAIMVASDAIRYFRNKQLEPTGNYRQVLKAQLKKDGLSLKDKDQALSNYYDEVAKNWKLGEMVYYKSEYERKGHFGIYLGKRDGKHQFAAAGNNTAIGEKDPMTSNGIISITEYGPNSKYDSAPVVWAKAPDKVQPPRAYSDTEIVRRASLMLGKPYKLEMLENNCESWASMIVSGVPHSTQVKRFTAVTQKLIAARDKVTSKVSGTGYTANQMATWLAFNHKRFVADSKEIDIKAMQKPADVLKPDMTELEAMSAVKRYLMVLIEAPA